MARRQLRVGLSPWARPLATTRRMTARAATCRLAVHLTFAIAHVMHRSLDSASEEVMGIRESNL